MVNFSSLFYSSNSNGSRDKISPKIASIQQRFLGAGPPTNDDVSNGEQQSQQPPSFKGFQDTLTRKKSPTTIAALVRQNSDLNLPPPPPPPRSSIPKGMLKKSTYEFGHPQQVRVNKQMILLLFQLLCHFDFSSKL